MNVMYKPKNFKCQMSNVKKTLRSYACISSALVGYSLLKSRKHRGCTELLCMHKSSVRALQVIQSTLLIRTTPLITHSAHVRYMFSTRLSIVPCPLQTEECFGKQPQQFRFRYHEVATHTLASSQQCDDTIRECLWSFQIVWFYLEVLEAIH